MYLEKNVLESLKEKVFRFIEQYQPTTIYIPPQLKFEESAEQGNSPAFQALETAFKNEKSPKGIVLLLGEAGMGKTFLGQQWIKQLWDNYKDGDYIPLWIPLISLGRDRCQRDILQEYFYKLCLDSELINRLLQPDCRFHLVLDGLDELPDLGNLYQTNEFDRRPIQVLFTSRREQFKHSSDYSRYLAPKPTDVISVLTVCAFTQENIKDYIQAYVKQVARGSKKLPWSAETYLQRLRELPQIDNLIQCPFVLQMIVRELPLIIAEVISDTKNDTETAPNKFSVEQIKITRYKVYEVFLRAWFKRAAKKTS